MQTSKVIEKINWRKILEEIIVHLDYDIYKDLFINQDEESEMLIQELIEVARKTANESC